jgi:TPP-dependent pyruvate/acetoin dehydrogenase alpha subunit
VLAAARDAVARARRGEGPTYLLCDTWRFSGHHAGDKQSYKDDAEAKAWAAKDPIEALGRKIVADGFADADALKEIRAGLEADIAKIADEARAMPEPAAETLAEFLHG